MRLMIDAELGAERAFVLALLLYLAFSTDSQISVIHRDVTSLSGSTPGISARTIKVWPSSTRTGACPWCQTGGQGSPSAPTGTLTVC